MQVSVGHVNEQVIFSEHDESVLDVSARFLEQNCLIHEPAFECS